MIRVEKNIQTSVGEVSKVTLQRGQIELELFSYGASIYSIKFNGLEVTVRPDDVDAFLNAEFYYGKTCGRTGGRLIMPSFQIDDKSYPITPFRGEATKLHGGALGFSYRHFELVSTHEENETSKVVFKIVSADGEEGYPGELTLFVTYTLDENNQINIAFDATTTKDTLCSITNHVYVNLDGTGTINNHHVQVEASKYVDLKPNLTPKGKALVENTPFDLRKLSSIDSNLKALDDTPIGGFDHTWLFDHEIGKAIISDSKNELALEVTTNNPAIVIFAHNIPSVDALPKRYGKGIRSGLTIECEYEPGGIHYPDMNSSILRQGETYHKWMNLRFEHKK